ncbi:hypothetical protein EGM51_12010 [Verrucomicrobia bacterium S94]|nr:hypothetical protein EGM51_12010 [Verrucomicrobia bacterium S94]
MKIKTGLLSAGLFAAIAVHAQVIIEDDFSAYPAGDIYGQGDWVASVNDAFVVDANSEMTMSADNSSLLLSGLNAVSLIPGDTVKITIDHRYSMRGGETPNYTLWSCGLQNTNAVGEGSSLISWIAYNGWENGRVTYFPDFENWWMSGEPSVWADCVDDLGADPKPNVGPVADPDTDNLQMIYEITKSDVTNEFRLEMTFINAASNVNESAYEVVSNVDIWNASDLYFHLSCMEPVANDCEVMIDRIKIEKTAPFKAPTGLTAIWPGSSVELSWDHMPGAAEYDVFRSETSGSFGAPIARVAEDSYTDSTAVAGTTYYYAVQAVYYNGNSANSDEVSPLKIYAGETVADIGFTAAEGYTDGDLAGQQGWESLTGSGSNAFNVITVSDVADSASSYSNYDTDNGNAVYFDRLIRNNEDDALEGYLDVMITAGSPAPGDSEFSNQSIMTFGLTASTTEKHHIWGHAAQALFNLTARGGGELIIVFDSPLLDNDNNRLAKLDADDLGWDPKNGGSRTTDPIRISFKLRKTRDENVYQAYASLSNLVSGASSINHSQIRIPYSTDLKADLYTAEYSYFTMGIHPQALDERSTTNGPVHTVFDSVNLIHTTNNLPVPAGPVITSVVSADRSIILSWDDVLDSSGYDIFMMTGGEEYTVAENVSKVPLGTVSLEDSPRWNGVTNTYIVRALFDADVDPLFMDSMPTSAVPQSLVEIVDMDGSRNDLIDSTSSTFYLSQVGAVTNAGADITYLDRRELTPMIAHGEVSGGVTYNGYTLYGLTQMPGTNGIASRYFIENAGSVGQRYYLSGGWNDSAPRQLAYIKIDDMDWEDAIPSGIDATSQLLTIYLGLVSYSDGNGGYLYPAIRNGSQWYVSDTGVRFGEGGSGAKDIRVSDVMAETWNELHPQVDVLMTAGSTLADNSILTDINAIGWFADKASYMCLSKFEVNVTGNTLPYEFWADDNGLSGADAAENADPDGDGVINKKEFAYGGDPNDAADRGALPVLNTAGTSHLGMEGFIYTYVKSRDPANDLAYELVTTDDLVNGTWTTNNHTVMGVENVDYQWQAVTNFVPTTEPKTFIKLDL